MAAYIIAEGSALVVREVSPDMASFTKFDLLGKPLAEVYLEPEYRTVLALMRLTLCTGFPISMRFRNPSGFGGTIILRSLGENRVLVRFRQSPDLGLDRLARATAALVPVVVAALSLC